MKFDRGNNSHRGNSFMTSVLEIDAIFINYSYMADKMSTISMWYLNFYYSPFPSCRGRSISKGVGKKIKMTKWVGVVTYKVWVGVENLANLANSRKWIWRRWQKWKVLVKSENNQNSSLQGQKTKLGQTKKLNPALEKS